ncbi:glycerol-3-phosphate dehydrogenase [Marinivivus vitaminiproducens]|uniref:glycerol-3-phosphate dehydrogenase n=1 Tax=Marinivivus vitaminiproducens TaxID=3035935 RepID=UPI0027AB47EC|nr:glycerol-3-phosphate dehydrogenase [Geminicoccaceae bacterium SCSIO 64248]
MSVDRFDILVIGGGINGCGIARDAAGRGYDVLLCEMDDLGSGTSSASTKLIHGGLRYLEHYEFRLVREALREREVLWRMAPHIVWPLRFVLPHHQGLRPWWLLRLGLFLYDHLGGRKLLPPTRRVDLRSDTVGAPLKDSYARAFAYSDCWVEDARMVVLNARSAAEHGATVRVRTEVASAVRDGDGWRAVLRDRRSGATREVRARVVVNAAGPWVDRVLGTVDGGTRARSVRLVQGSHVVVRQLFPHDRAYIFQNGDGRIVFAIPYEGDFTLIGTTDRDFEGNPSEVRISEDETNYLLAAAGAYFAQPVARDAVVWAYSGVRPLFEDGASRAQEATRDYVLRVDGQASGPKLINVFGGKLTTYRRLAEAVLGKVGDAIGGRGRPWTSGEALPGGAFPVEGFPVLLRKLGEAYPGFEAGTLRRLARAYGTDAWSILGDARRPADLGRDFGAGLSAVEVDHLVTKEWALTADDILWRRSKLGLRIDRKGREALDHYMAERTKEQVTAA